MAGVVKRLDRLAIDKRVELCNDASLLPFASPAGNDAFAQTKAYLKSLGLSPAAFRVGRALTLDPKTETFESDPEANALLRRDYRKPFVVPEQV